MDDDPWCICTPVDQFGCFGLDSLNWGIGGGSGVILGNEQQSPPEPDPGDSTGSPVAGQTIGCEVDGIPCGMQIGGGGFPDLGGCTYGGGSCGGMIYGWTGQLGWSGQVSRWGWYLSLAFGLAVDFHGTIAGWGSVGGGKAVGASGGTGVQVGVSNADTVCGLGGPFANMSATVGAGEGGTLDVWGGKGNGPGGVVTGVSGTYGPTVGGSASYGGSRTSVVPFNSAPCK